MLCYISFAIIKKDLGIFFFLIIIKISHHDVRLMYGSISSYLKINFTKEMTLRFKTHNTMRYDLCVCAHARFLNFIHVEFVKLLFLLCADGASG